MKTEEHRTTYVFICDTCQAFKRRTIDAIPTGWEQTEPAYGLAPYGRHRCANCIRESKGLKRREPKRKGRRV